MVKKSSYWKNRTKELMQYAEQQDKVMFQELAKLYSETFKDVQKEIFAFYAKYAEDNKITIQEAKQRLRRTDLSDYRENARRYREEVKTPELLERLNEQYVSSKATRLDALKLDLTYQLGLLQGKVSGSFDSYLKKLAKHSYRKISGGLSDSTLNEPALEQLVKTPFKGYNYSQQVWGNVDHLARDLHKTLTRGFVKGFSPHEMATEIRKRHDVARHRAETLVRTDGSMVINNATLKRYKDVGLKLYRIHVHIDSRTSDICMNISKLDKAYKLSEAQPGYNMPPLHPNCRSTIVPDDEDMDRADERDIEFVRNYDKIGLEERFDYVMNGEELFIPKGAEITNVKVIAGKGSGTELRVKHKLVNQYGGNPNDWQKAVGKIESAKYMFDMHWYRKNDTEQTEIKLKLRRDKK
ncbi:minor capsid protein [Aerococcus christensenii]|uniref:Phage protein F-like protein n=1 Tax=Aerococcus christensenii TaxID=87541 RepID=A0A133XVA7_9LACT|nr:minor capsid protein [Aerococcus christensenii]KXB34874.1 phage protein F-like protein [Aerococcus christensenii]MDK8233939.1 minor capsid protein [Aerococcus christensenii]